MGLIDSIKGCISEELFVKEPTFRAVLFGEVAGYFENVCQIVKYQQNEIELSLKKGGLIIRGENLYVKKYCAGDVVICGKILSLERV